MRIFKSFAVFCESRRRIRDLAPCGRRRFAPTEHEIVSAARGDELPLVIRILNRSGCSTAGRSPWARTAGASPKWSPTREAASSRKRSGSSIGP